MARFANEFSIGHLADLHCISEKALRIYQQKGLLEPARVDESSGYRYYTYEQCSTVDMIQQLQSLGVTLDEIKCLMDGDDPNKLGDLLERHLERIEDELKRLAIAKQNALQLLEKEAVVRNRPPCNQIMLEHIGERRLLVVDLPEPCSLNMNDTDLLFRQWELNLGHMRKRLRESGVPLSLFHMVGDLIPREELVARTFCITSYFVMLDERALDQVSGYRTLPSGQYLTIYKDHFAEPDGSNTERHAIDEMLDFAESRGFEVAGDYLGEIVAETPIFSYRGREVLMKLQIPVHVAG